MDNKEINLELMVELIKSHDCLYNYSSKSYKNKYLKEKAWNQIAKTLKTNVWELKKKWKNMRDSYTKELKKKGNEKRKRWRYMELLSFLSNGYNKSDQSTEYNTESNSMAIDETPSFKFKSSPNQTGSNFSDESNSSNCVPNFLSIGQEPTINSESEQLTIEPVEEFLNPLEMPSSSLLNDFQIDKIKLKKLNPLIAGNNATNDQDDLFALSVAGRLRELSKTDNFYIKMKIMELFYDLARK